MDQRRLTDGDDWERGTGDKKDENQTAWN